MAILSCRMEVACIRVSHTCKGLKDAWVQPCQKTTNIVVKQNLHGVLMVALKPSLTQLSNADKASIPMQPARDPQRVGWCNDALPDTNVYARFLYFVRYLAANGFYVIIDNHFNVDSLAIDQPDTWVGPPFI